MTDHDPSTGQNVAYSKLGDHRQLTKAEKLALAEHKRLEIEQNQKERERKIKQREKKKRDLRKMTGKGQPVMKTRLEDLLGKIKKVMK
jgi:rRNA processing